VTAKFFQDCLVEHKVIPDDDTEHIVKLVFVPGGVDKDDPRIDIEVKEETNETT